MDAELTALGTPKTLPSAVPSPAPAEDDPRAPTQRKAQHTKCPTLKGRQNPNTIEAVLNM